jgi:hypothetical protein
MIFTSRYLMITGNPRNRDKRFFGWAEPRLSHSVKYDHCRSLLSKQKNDGACWSCTVSYAHSTASLSFVSAYLEPGQPKACSTRDLANRFDVSSPSGTLKTHKYKQADA